MPDVLRFLPRTIRASQPTDTVIGWSISIRGPAVFLVSPPGWAPGVAPDLRREGGEVHAFEIARSACTLEWVDAELDKVQKFDAPPFKRQGVPEGE